MICGEVLRLNLGSRGRVIPGFKNLDIEKHPNVDYVGDASDLKCFSDESVQEIYASHILEHFPHKKSLSVLKEWSRVLKKGGILYLATPDFSRAVELYKVGGLDDFIVNTLWGDQEYYHAFHYAGFDEPRLRRLLVEVGFSDISRVEDFNLNKEDCSTNVCTLDYKSVSLNMVAVK